MARSIDRHPVFVVVTILTFFAWGTGSSASPRSAVLVGRGSDLMAGGRFDEALGHFDAAARDDPTDAEAPFFSGVALNRLGRPEDALAQLRRSHVLGFDSPDLDFELGWALVSQRRWDEAIERLERFERRSAGRGQTSEFLGRAYLGRGEHDRATAAFDEALRRDPSLVPTVGIYRALIHQRLGDEAAAGNVLAGLVNTAPDSITGRFVRSQLGPVDTSTSPVRRWWLGGSFGGGYNSDARGIPDLFPGSGGAPNDFDEDEGSGFSRAELDGGILLVSRDDWRLSVGYELLGDFYAEQQHDPDLLDQTITVLSAHRFSDSLGASLRLWDNYTLLGEEELRNQAGASASLRAKLTGSLALDVSYSHARNDYLFRTPAVLDRDADTHTPGLSLEFSVPGTPVVLRGGYFHSWNFADGADFASQSDTLVLGFSTHLPWRFRADFSYLRTFEHYEFRNTASEPRERRRDDIDAVRFRLSRPISRRVGLFVQYDLSDDDSNIRGYGYEQHVVSAGLTWSL